MPHEPDDMFPLQRLNLFVSDLLRDTPIGKPIVHACFVLNFPPSIAGDARQVSQFGGLPYTVSTPYSHTYVVSTAIPLLYNCSVRLLNCIALHCSQPKSSSSTCSSSSPP